MKKENKIAECPSPEILSSFFDGSLPADSSEAEHIKTCPKCASVLNTYGIIDKTIRDSATKNTPEDLPERIKNKVHLKLSMEKERSEVLRFPPLILKVAAGFALAALIGLYIAEFTGRKEIPETSAAVAKHAESVSAGGAIPYECFKKVSFTSKEPSNLEAPPEIYKNVCQVWAVQDMKNAETRIKSISGKLGIPAPEMTREDNGKILKANFKISKMQLVKLVKSCEASGFRLLSPFAPQPEQNVFSGNSKENVDYEASFVLAPR